MPYMADQVVAHLYRGLIRAAGVEVTYQQGAAKQQLRGIKGGRTQVLELPDGTTIQTTDDDWIFLKCQLAVVPKIHDKITWHDGRTMRTFVAASDNTEGPFDHVDQFNKLIRVHTIEKNITAST